LDASQKKNLTGAAVIVMSSIVLSRITGFLRTVLINNLLHNEMSKDALFMAFTITDLLYFLLVGGAISAALIPVLSGYLARNEEEEGWKAVSTFINITFIAITVLGLLGILFSPQLVKILASGFDGEKAALTVRLMRILFPSVSFLMLAGLTNGVLNSYQRFAAAAYGPILYNIGSIFSLLVFHKSGVDRVAAGIMGSAVFYFLFQISFAFRNFKFYRFKIYLKHPGFIKLFKLAVPSLLASSITQINVLISQSYNSNFQEGSVTALKNATDIWQLPYGIFAMGIGMAILPTLSERFALNELESFKDIMIKSLKTTFLLIIPSTIGLIVLGDQVISAIYKWSAKIDAPTIGITYKILVFFTIALLSQSVVAIANRAFYANNDTKTPLFVGAGTIAVNGGLCFLFFHYTSLGAAGMAFSYSVSSAVYAVVLLSILEKKLNGVGLEKLTLFFLKVFFASMAMGVVLFLIKKEVPLDFARVFSVRLKMEEILWLFFELAAGVAVYFGAVLAMKVEEAVYIQKVTVGKIKNIIARLSRKA
jgi:putative peptidoglycan lipid II flippase